jgi:hypothetical protein
MPLDQNAGSPSFLIIYRLNILAHARRYTAQGWRVSMSKNTLCTLLPASRIQRRFQFHGRQLANDSLKAQLQATWPSALTAGAAGFACRAQNVSGPAKFGPADRSEAWHTTNPDAGGKENSLRFLHFVSDLKRAATIAPGSVWKARISLPPLTRNPRRFMGEGSGGSVNTNCTEQSVST